MAKMFDVFGMENSLIDIQAFVSDEFLEEVGVHKGIMHLIEEDRSRFLLEKLQHVTTEMVPGGSCANAIRAIAFLGGKPVYTGVVAEDEYGTVYEEKLRGYGVKTITKWVRHGMTGSSIILTTPDAERTMNTHLGVCREISKSDVDLDTLKQCQVFYTTGYMWDTAEQKDTVLFTMEQAKHSNLKVSFDLADPFLIERNHKEFPEIIKEYVDILFGNEREVTMLTGLKSPIDAGKALRNWCDIAVVKVGKDGAYVFSDDVDHIPVFPVKAVDTTGAGDSFAGGFLYTYCQGGKLAECGRVANYIASRIVTVKGLGFDLLDRDAFRKELGR